MKTLIVFLFVCLSTLAHAAADSLQPLELRQVKLGGELGRRIEVTITNNLLVLDMEKDFLAPFKVDPAQRKGAYIGLGKLIDAAVRFAAHTGDEGVKTFKQRLVAETIAAQETDGYIGTMAPTRRIWTLWDIHEMGYLVYGLTSDHRFFGEKPSLNAACKLANYILMRWAATPPKEPSPWDITLHMGVTGIENAMLALHRETGDKRYLEFVTQTRRLREWPARIVTGRHGPIEGHIYAHICRCIAQLRLDRLQPDTRLLKPTRDALDFMLNRNGMTITGECGDHECWHDTHEGTMNLGESCATAYLVRWLDELLRSEGESLYGDVMERMIYNGLFAAQSPDGRRIRYYTPMDGPRDYHKGDTYCCPNNYRRTIAELPSYVYYRAAGGVTVNLYTAGEAAIELKGGIKLRVQQETDYPNTGKVTLRIEPSKPAHFLLRLRIPRWCDEPAVSVNGEPLKKIKGGEFLSIARVWKSGDRVEMDLAMPLRLVAGRLAQVGRVAVMRGPQVFCLNRSRHAALANSDLRLLVIDPRSVEGPFPDDAVRPGGVACRVNAWPAGAWYPAAQPRLKLELTEFADPGGEFTYFKIPDPNEGRVGKDELAGP